MIADRRFHERCERATCRGCKRLGLEPVLDLGPMPPSDGLLTRERLGDPEQKFRLDVGFCFRLLSRADSRGYTARVFIWRTALLDHSRANAFIRSRLCRRSEQTQHGKFMPNVHLEILPPERLLRDMPDY
jgi:hypothetical protein